MSDNQTWFDRVLPLHDMKIGAADRGQGDFDDRFTHACGREHNVFNPDVIDTTEHGCLHSRIEGTVGREVPVIEY